MVPRENKNNAYANFGGQTKSIMVFSEVAYCEIALKEPAFLKGCTAYCVYFIKELKNQSDPYL